MLVPQSCSLYKQGGRYEVSLTFCPSMATPLLLQPETYCPEGQAHPRPSECDCGQVVPQRSDNLDEMVPPTSSVIRPGTVLRWTCLRPGTIAN